MKRVRGRKKKGGLFGGTDEGWGEAGTGQGKEEGRERNGERWKKSEMERERQGKRTERPGSECAHRTASIPPPAFPACTHSCSCTAAVARSCAHARLRARLSHNLAILSCMCVFLYVCIYIYIKYITILRDAQQRRRRAVLTTSFPSLLRLSSRWTRLRAYRPSFLIPNFSWTFQDR